MKHDPITNAVDTIQNELRRLRMESANWRKKASQNAAQAQLLRKQLDDALAHVDRLIAHQSRNGVAA